MRIRNYWFYYGVEHAYAKAEIRNFFKILLQSNFLNSIKNQLPYALSIEKL